MKWSSQALRQRFLEYFAAKGHHIVSSSRLIPNNDPSLLFTNAGMVQFKNIFLGLEAAQYLSVASTQRCLRAGGKHNDLDAVGYTARHHTFFEMLGNFSFGTYFKREAIQLAWNFMTCELAIPVSRLWVTVYENDEESATIWLDEIGVDPTRFSRCGEADNFWRMGDTGPCGPCTEIFYDHGPEIPGGPPGSATADGDRYIEIWNLVFMQFERRADGKLLPLAMPAVDTGMGLERLAAVMQGVHSNYETDLFQPLIQAAARLANTSELNHRSLYVIADHIRATAFLILDGIKPGNEGRAYVLRRIIRRAVRHGYLLGITRPFFSDLLPTLVEIMQDAYPELQQAQNTIATAIQQEEQQFAKTLIQGMRLLNQVLSELTSSEIPGETVFKLYDTYGFPTDLTADIAREHQLSIDWQGFEAAMAEQRERAQKNSQFSTDYQSSLVLTESSVFTEQIDPTFSAQCIGLYTTESICVLNAGMQGYLVLDKTPFYPEGGGQIGDTGVIYGAEGEFIVENTQKKQQAILHIGYVKRGVIRVGEQMTPQIDWERRRKIMANHSATHLLQAALQQLLPEQVEQKGSLVTSERLRFDFSYSQPLSQQQLYALEIWVNQQIRDNHSIHQQLLPYVAAIQQGAIALFDEKYGAEVRMLTIGTASKELCGGTHANTTGELGLFKIISEIGVAAGIRRIEAVTGAAAIAIIQEQEKVLHQVGQILKVPVTQVVEKILHMREQLTHTRKITQQLQQQLALTRLAEIQQQASKIGEITLLAAEFPEVEPILLRQAVLQSLANLPQAIVVLATVHNNQITIMAGVAKSLIPTFNAGELVQYVAAQVGGKGGGNAELAQAGGTLLESLPQALASVKAWVQELH